MRSDFDPQQLEVLSTDARLAPVPAAELEVGSLRRRFRSPPTWSPEMSGEHRVGSRAPAEASVLIALVPRSAGLNVLLTQRSDHLTDHPGQISFPGGRAEARDADAVTTALREAEEEIGLKPAFVEVLGRLPAYVTGTGFIVTPVVACVRPGFSVTAEPLEVAEVFEVPLAFLMTPANHRWHAVERLDGAVRTRREFLSMPWEGVDQAGAMRRFFIWGATAAMIRNLYGFLSA